MTEKERNIAIQKACNKAWEDYWKLHDEWEKNQKKTIDGKVRQLKYTEIFRAINIMNDSGAWIPFSDEALGNMADFKGNVINYIYEYSTIKAERDDEPKSLLFEKDAISIIEEAFSLK